MKTLLKLFFAIFMPWLVFLFTDRPGAAVIALVLQATIIGWLPASLWAVSTVMDDKRATDAVKTDEDDEEE